MLSQSVSVGPKYLYKKFLFCMKFILSSKNLKTYTRQAVSIENSGCWQKLAQYSGGKFANIPYGRAQNKLSNKHAPNYISNKLCPKAFESPFLIFCNEGQSRQRIGKTESKRHYQSHEVFELECTSGPSTETRWLSPLVN